MDDDLVDRVKPGDRVQVSPIVVCMLYRWLVDCFLGRSSAIRRVVPIWKFKSTVNNQ